MSGPAGGPYEPALHVGRPAFYTSAMHVGRIVLALLLATASIPSHTLRAKGTPAGTRAQQPPVVDVTMLGPRVGETAPDFEAPDQHGTTRRLSALLGSRGALLVFYRSADW